MRNKYKGKCFKCGKDVPAGHGFFQLAIRKYGGKEWLVRCVGCVGKGNKL